VGAPVTNEATMAREHSRNDLKETMANIQGARQVSGPMCGEDRRMSLLLPVIYQDLVQASRECLTAETHREWRAERSDTASDDLLL
jgi:hypothetical protein